MNTSCGHLFNRDHLGAVNIAGNLERQLDGLPLISHMSQDELDNALHTDRELLQTITATLRGIFFVRACGVSKTWQ
jgi:hypothetical protein